MAIYLKESMKSREAEAKVAALERELEAIRQAQTGR